MGNITEYVRSLVYDEDRLRFNFEKEKGKITVFSIQYETKINVKAIIDAWV